MHENNIYHSTSIKNDANIFLSAKFCMIKWWTVILKTLCSMLMHTSKQFSAHAWNYPRKISMKEEAINSGKQTHYPMLIANIS